MGISILPLHATSRNSGMVHSTTLVLLSRVDKTATGGVPEYCFLSLLLGVLLAILRHTHPNSVAGFMGSTTTPFKLNYKVTSKNTPNYSVLIGII